MKSKSSRVDKFSERSDILTEFISASLDAAEYLMTLTEVEAPDLSEARRIGTRIAVSALKAYEAIA